MKKIIMMIAVFAIAFTGCSKNEISEREFDVLWQEYLRIEFEESFDEKQSVSQRENILKELLSAYKFSLEEFKLYMKKNHDDKYKKIFIDR